MLKTLKLLVVEFIKLISVCYFSSKWLIIREIDAIKFKHIFDIFWDVVPTQYTLLEYVEKKNNRKTLHL